MKRTIWTYVFIFLLATCFFRCRGQGLIIDPYRFGNPAQGSLLLDENFEGSNNPNPPQCFDLTGWTVAGSGATEYTRNTASEACGAASLQIMGGTEGQFAHAVHVVTAATDYTNLFFHVRAKTGIVPVVADRQFFRFTQSGSGSAETNGVIRLYWTTGGNIRVRSGTANVATVNSFSADTWYHVWGNYNALAATGYVAFSATSSFPTDPNAFAVYSSGNTNSIRDVWCTAPGVCTNSWDTIRIRTGTVGDIDCN